MVLRECARPSCTHPLPHATPTLLAVPQSHLPTAFLQGNSFASGCSQSRKLQIHGFKMTRARNLAQCEALGSLSALKENRTAAAKRISSPGKGWCCYQVRGMTCGEPLEGHEELQGGLISSARGRQRSQGTMSRVGDWERLGRIRVQCCGPRKAARRGLHLREGSEGIWDTLALNWIHGGWYYFLLSLTFLPLMERQRILVAMIFAETFQYTLPLPKAK